MTISVEYEGGELDLSKVETKLFLPDVDADEVMYALLHSCSLPRANKDTGGAVSLSRPQSSPRPSPSPPSPTRGLPSPSSPLLPQTALSPLSSTPSPGPSLRK